MKSTFRRALSAINVTHLAINRKTLIAIAAIALTGILADHSRAALEDGLRNYWPFDGGLEDLAADVEGSASTIADDGEFDSLNALDGIDFGPGLFGGAGLEQNGAAGENQNDGFVVVPRSEDTLYGETSTLSISTWVNAAGFDTNWQTIVSHGEGSQYRIARRGGDSVAAYAGGSGDIPGSAIGPNIGAGTGWHHIVAISESGVSTRIWVDGGLIATGDAPTIMDNGNDGAPGGSTPDLYIGANPQTGDQNREWFGQIDDVGMWDRVLSEDEIAGIYTNGLSGCSLLDDSCGSGPLFPTGIPGPSGGNGFFGAREITDNGTIDGLSAAVESATNGGGTNTEGQFPILDVANNAEGGPVLTGPPLPYLSANPQDITSVSKGTIRVTEGGDYTLQASALSGFGLRVVGEQFNSIHGAGIIDPNDPSSIVKFEGTDNTRGTLNLDPGDYEVEVLSWGGEGDVYVELTSAQGIHENQNSAQWLAVGDDTVLPEATVGGTVSLSENVVVANGDAAGDLVTARANGQAGLAGPYVKQADSLVLHDPGADACPSGPGQLTARDDVGVTFPINDVDGPALDNFSTYVVGEIVVNDGDDDPDEILDLTFGLFSDDRGQFRIIGADFTDTAGNENTTLVDVDGDMALTGDLASCNSDSIGHIMLEEGSYGFEGIHTEEGGNAGWQIWWAEGFVDVAGDPLVPLTSPQLLPANSGLALVGGGVEPWPGDVNGDGKTDVADLNVIGINWQMSGKTREEGDLTGDGLVNVADLNELGVNWQTMRPGAAAVPEPGGVALLLAGLLAGCGYLRRKRS